MFQQKDYSYLIDQNEYQVFLFKSQIFFPLNFAIHPWFVLNNKGELSRWEIGFAYSDKNNYNHWGYLYKNWKPHYQGIGFFPFIKTLFNQSKPIGCVKGKEAQKMIEFIFNSYNRYPYCNKYHLWGPNSNTYAKWVIDNFPESGLRLPDNAFGKNYKK